jgi:hypothetical protein
MTSSISFHGPLFQNNPQQIVKQHLHLAQEVVAREGDKLVHMWLRMKLKHPTGAYEHSVITDLARSDPRIIGDRKIYGAWLEGVSRRNRTTRFKGYKTFRIATQDLQKDAVRLTQPVVDQMVRALSGTAGGSL